MPTLPTGGQVAPEWAKSIISSIADTDGFASSLVVDGNYLYAAVKYRSVAPIVLSASVTLPASPTYVYCILKLDASLSLGTDAAVSVIYLPGAVTLDFYRSVAVQSGDIYVCGTYISSSAAVSLGNGVSLGTTPATADVFLIKYNSSGVAQWAKQISGTSTDSAYGVIAGSDVLYIYGRINSTSSVSLGDGFSLNATTSAEGYLIKYNSSGTVTWVKQMAGTVYGVNIAGSRVYVSGTYSPSAAISFGNDASGVDVSLPNTGAMTNVFNGFVVALSSDMVPIWARRIPASTGGTIHGVAGTADALYICGTYNTASVRYLGAGDTIELPITSVFDLVVAKYDLSGTALWANTMKGSVNDEAYSIAVTDTDVYVAGRYISSTAITAGSIPASQSQDGILLKYALDGTFGWYKRVSASSVDTVFSVVASGSRIFIAGRYEGAAAVNVATGVDLPLGYNSFIIEYSAAGDYTQNLTISSNKDVNGSTRGIYAYGDSVYVVGSYTSSVIPINLGNGVSLPLTPGTDGYIIKYTAAGVPVWAKTISGTGADGSMYVYASESEVYVSGYYSSTSAISIGNSVSLPLSTMTAAFLIKYDVNGNPQWATALKAASSMTGYRVSASSDSVYLCGNYSSGAAVTVGTKADGTTLSLGTTTGIDGFIIKYTSAGVPVWAKQIKGSGTDITASVSVNDTGVFIAGYYTSTSTVALGTRTSDNTALALPITAVNTAYIVKCDAIDGSPLWYNTIAASTVSNILGSAATSDGIYVCGNVNTTSSITLSTGVTISATQGNSDAYIVKYNNAGTAVLASQFGSTGVENTNGICVYGSNIYITGSFGGITSGSVTLPAAISGDMYLVKFDLSCNAVWAKQVQGSSIDTGYDVSVTANGVYVCGYYISTFPVSVGNNITLPATGGLNIVGSIFKYSTLEPATVTVVPQFTNASVAWPSSSTSYKMYYHPTADATALVELATASTTISGLQAGTAYTLYFSTVADSVELLSSAYSFTTRDQAAPFVAAVETLNLADVSANAFADITTSQVSTLISSGNISTISAAQLTAIPSAVISEISGNALADLVDVAVTVNTAPVTGLSPIATIVANSNPTELAAVLTTLAADPATVTTLAPVFEAALVDSIELGTVTKTQVDALIDAYGKFAQPGAEAPKVVITNSSLLGVVLTGATSTVENKDVYIIPDGTSGLTIPISAPPAIKLAGDASFAINGEPVAVVFGEGTVIINGTVISLTGPATTITIGGYIYECALVGSATFVLLGPAPVPVCFLADAPVLTPSGYRPIASLREGDKVVTSDGRSVAINRVFRKQYEASPSNNPYVIPKGSYGALRALPISPNHEVLVAGRGMVKAKDLGLPRLKMSGPFVYYNLELDNWVHDNLVVAGVVCESLMQREPIYMTEPEYIRTLCNRYGIKTSKEATERGIGRSIYRK